MKARKLCLYIPSILFVFNAFSYMTASNLLVKKHEKKGKKEVEERIGTRVCTWVNAKLR